VVEVLEPGILSVSCGALFGVTMLLGVTLIMHESMPDITIVNTNPRPTPVRNRWQAEASGGLGIALSNGELTPAPASHPKAAPASQRVDLDPVMGRNVS